MANSRIMLTCKHCGKQIALGKGYIGAYGCVTTNMENHLNEFFKEHEHGMCSDDPINSMSDNARDHFLILEEGERLEDFAGLELVKHGEWLVEDYNNSVFSMGYKVYCSCCGYQENKGPAWDIEWGVHPYCPSCGAKMDGGKA